MTNILVLPISVGTQLWRREWKIVHFAEKNTNDTFCETREVELSRFGRISHIESG